MEAETVPLVPFFNSFGHHLMDIFHWKLGHKTKRTLLKGVETMFNVDHIMDQYSPAFLRITEQNKGLRPKFRL